MIQQFYFNPKEVKARSQGDMCASTFPAALPTIARGGRNPRACGKMNKQNVAHQYSEILFHLEDGRKVRYMLQPRRI